MYEARLKRPTPYVDKTVYVSWNALSISAYLQAARALSLEEALHFAFRSLDRILSDAWSPETGLKHVIAYSDANAAKRDTPGFLDDYAFTAIASLDAYESTADLSYFKIARQITDRMIEQFYDPAAGGFVDAESKPGSLGVLSTPRKPFQDSPTPAGNSMAVIALLRLHGYTDEAEYRDKAEQTLELLSGAAGQYGLFAATYGIAATYFATPHAQIVVIGEDEAASQLYSEAMASSFFGRSILKLKFSQVVAPNLPPTLAQTIPQLPALKHGRSLAVVCSGSTCKPPVHTPEQLKQILSVKDSAA
jgi:uncharacterized protein YyaL (SSP411 family)